MEPKRIAILGSTGSIGLQALEIIARGDHLSACGLAAGSNWEELARQAERFGPEAVAIAADDAADDLAAAVPEATEVLAGEAAMSDLVRRTRPDMVLTAVVGSAGPAPTLAAIECGADLAIANKESLVMAGAVVVPAARAAGVNVLPVDSEHSAVFQCLQGRPPESVRRVILTASGGPFRTWPAEKIRRASLAEVLNHPTWQMGPKVTIDSATMMNKALEVIEAHWLFGLGPEKIQVLIHPESIVHGCVEFTDGSVLAQLGSTSMATPISYALHYPARAAEAPAPLDLAAVGALHFERVDAERFPAVELAYQVVAAGGTAGAVLNAANEAAVAAFVDGEIEFGRIVEIVREVLNQMPVNPEVNVGTVIAADAEARRQAERIVAAGSPAPRGRN